jgi:hypothetical protein
MISRLVLPALKAVRATFTTIAKSRAGAWLGTSLSVGSWGYLFYDLALNSSSSSVSTDPLAVIPTTVKRILLLNYVPRTMVNPMIEEGLVVYNTSPDTAIVLFAAAQYAESYPRLVDLCYSDEDLAEAMEQVMDDVVKLPASAEMKKIYDTAMPITEEEVSKMDLATRRLTDFYCFMFKILKDA